MEQASNEHTVQVSANDASVTTSEIKLARKLIKSKDISDYKLLRVIGTG